MSDSKVFMFPDQGTNNSGLMSMLAPLLQQKGVDPNGGEAVTVSEFKGIGIYLGYYDGKTKSLQIIL